MRQAGIVAAAGLYALEHNVERLADDHARARRLAEGWAERGVPVDLDAVETNFVQVDVGALGLTSAEAIARLAAARRRAQRHGQARASCARSRTSTSTTTTSSGRSSSSRARWSSLPAPDELARELDRIARRSARPSGCPSVAAAVVRDGEVDLVGRGRRSPTSRRRCEATPETQYRIGSITKTFTAVADHAAARRRASSTSTTASSSTCPGSRTGSPTIRRMLAHLSGLQREAGEMFVDRRRRRRSTSCSPRWTTYELVLPAGAGPPLLESRLRPARRGRRRVRPACRTPSTSTTRSSRRSGSTRTTWHGAGSRARSGYLVDEYAGTLGREPHSDMGGVAAMGQLWSTVGDLCTLGGVPCRRPRRRARAGDGRRDVVAAGDDEPGRLDASAGASASSCAATTGGSSAVTAGRCRASWPVSTSTARRRSARPC